MYIVSFEVAGASDGVPHHRLMKAMERFGVGAHIRRVVHGRPLGRTFQVKLKEHGGVYRSDIHEISRGLSQRGVLSPLL